MTWRSGVISPRIIVVRSSSSGAAPAASPVPLLKAGTPVVGIDRSDAMLDRARRRARRAGVARRARFVRGDIRDIPFRSSCFDLVMAPYGILQSLTRERDLQSTLESVARVLRRGGLFGIDLVPDLPRWHEYKRKLSLHGRRSATTTLTLIESVRQDRRRRLTIFDQEYVERRGRTRRVHRFALTFRTLSVPQMVSRLEAAGFCDPRDPRRLSGQAVGRSCRRVGHPRGQEMRHAQ